MDDGEHRKHGATARRHGERSNGTSVHDANSSDDGLSRLRRRLKAPASARLARVVTSVGAHALLWTITYGAALSGVVAAVAVAALLRDRRKTAWAAAAVAAAAAPFVWNAILRHTGGDFFVDAPIVVFPISLQDTGSGVFATALSAVLLGLGPLRAASGRRLALAAALCGVSALLVDVYLY